MKKIIIVILAVALTISARSQLTVELGANRTELKDRAFTFGLSYIRSLDSIFGNQELFIPGKHSFLLFTPEFDVKTGTADAYSSIVLKASGIWNVFKTKTMSGLIGPDYNRTFHSFPLSIGVETNNQFNNTNGIVELGWVPFYQSYARSSPEWIKRTRFGIFVQGGYKFNLDSSGIGGELYGAEEKVRRGIFRGRGLFSLDTDAFLNVGAIKVGIVGSAEGWADIVNSEFYHKIEGRVRVYLSPNQYFDFLINKGSGAPLFNEATQGGVALTFKL